MIAMKPSVPGLAGFVVPAVTAFCAALPAWTSTSAMDVALANPSFEQPAITPPEEGATDLDFVNYGEIPGWQKFGVFKQLVPGVVEGKLDVGVFINTPFDRGDGTIITSVPNADGNQLAFMVVESTASGAETTSVLQTTGEAFEPGLDYQFTLGVGSSLNAPLGALIGGDPQNPEMLEMIIGYGATNGDDITPVATKMVSAFDLNADLANFQVPLTDFTSSTGLLDPSDAAIGEDIQVVVRQVGGNAGAFNIDNARLVSVPEPSSLALVGLSFALFARRRRTPVGRLRAG